jgi:hypothetical protein
MGCYDSRGKSTMAMTIEQQRALALATARLRLQQQQQQPTYDASAETMASGIQAEAPTEPSRPGALTSFIKGAVLDVPEAITQMVGGEEARQQVAERERSFQAARQAAGDSGFDIARLAGTVASPANIAAGFGAARGAAALGAGGLTQAATVGAVTSGLQPTSSSSSDLASFLADKGEQIGYGAIAGALTQVGLAGLGKTKDLIKDVISPLTKGGKERILREKLNEFSGPEREKVLEALKNASALVPGSRPTAAEAVADIPSATGLAAFQQRLAKSQEGGVSAQFAAREAEQQAARQSALQRIAGTPELLELSKQLREFDAARNYGAAFAESVTANPALATLARNPYFRDALPDAIKLSEATGITAKTDLTQFLQNVKISLDKQLAKTGETALADAEKRQVAIVKSDLLKWLKDKNPLYEKARDQFAIASKPINEMEVGQYLLNKLNSPLDTERAGQFALAVRDAATTIQKASGGPRYEKLADVLKPRQVAAVNNVLADLTRAQKAIESGRKTNIGGLSIDDSPELPQLLSRTATITNTLLRALKRNANTELNAEAAKLLADPKQLAVFMSAVPKSRTKDIVDVLYARMTPENRQILNRVLAVEAVVGIENQPE